MPLLTELGNFLGCDFYKYVAPERGLVCCRLAAQPHAAPTGVIFSGQNFRRAQSQNCETKQNLAGSSRCYHRDCVDWPGRVYCWLCINRTQLSALYLQFSNIKQFVLHHRFCHQWLSGRWKPLASLGNCCSYCLDGQYLQRDIFWSNNYPVSSVSYRGCNFCSHRRRHLIAV